MENLSLTCPIYMLAPGISIANEAPSADFEGIPKLTPRMIARIQGFPDTWFFGKTKTRACRMIGNAFPPPVAKAVGEEIRRCLLNENSTFDKGKSSLSQETLDFNFDYR